MNDYFVDDYKVKEWKLWKANGKDVYSFDIMEDIYIPHDVDVAINLENESRLGK